MFASAGLRRGQLGRRSAARLIKNAGLAPGHCARIVAQGAQRCLELALRPLDNVVKFLAALRTATFGLSRLATAQALGGFMMPAPLPEISQRLLPASSQA